MYVPLLRYYMFVVLRITFNKLNNNYNETVDFANDFVS